MRWRTAPPLAVLCLVALVGCGGSDAGSDEAASANTQDEGGDTVTDDTAGVQVSGEPDAKPEIDVPDKEAPAELVVADLVEGDGDEATAGASVTTHYVGVSWSNGEQFDASWDRGEPITFPLTGVISGWQEGIPGMRVGGRRLLVIPPDMAYGDTPPAGSGIEPGETLVFVIDLVATG
jgi:peptidylprolyl isomerase